MTRLVSLASVAVCAALFVSNASALTLQLHNTGVNADHTVRAPGSAELHYRLISSPEGTNARVTANHPNWLANNSTSRWISSQSYGYGGQSGPTTSAVGTYVYEYTFDLSAFSLASISSITGRWSTDNNAVMTLNGLQANVLTGSTTTFTAFGGWTTFSLNTSALNQGLNTLTFTVTNGAGATGNPTGLRVEFNPTLNVQPAAVAPVPEPFTMGLVGAAALAALKRRKKK